MKFHILSRFLPLAIFVHTSVAVGTHDQVGRDINYGTFQNPSSTVRPRFRYWTNDASVNLSRVVEDVKSMASVGAGGLEVLGYYLYGDEYGYLSAIVQSDWTIYGFGSTAWKNLQDTILQAAQEEGLLVDFAIGPNQGAGVPAPYNDDGLLWALDPYSMSVTKETSHIASIPGWGGQYNTETLVAAVTGLVTSQDGTQVTLQSTSLHDVTSLVGADGSLDLQWNATTDAGSEYVLFAFYLQRSESREVRPSNEVVAAVPQSPILNYRENGSWVVDHFSKTGAQLIIDFWNDSLLSGGTSDALLQVGNFMWEDSQEYWIGTNLLWTPKLPDIFLSNRRYNISNYLPFIVTANLAGVTTLSGIKYISDEEDGGQSHIHDYQQTLTELNSEYLTALTNWSNSLGIQFSSQVVYDLPMDMLANIPLVDGPECETLGFSHNIDGYRQFAGPANLAGKQIISSEAGAVGGLTYQQTIPTLLWDLKRSIAGGINQFVLHGYPFSGDYGNTTWPGFVTFNFLFSEMHGPRQPAWGFYGEWLNWTARTQFIAQTGIPKVDLVFWSKLGSYSSISTQYAPTDLVDAGFTYEYLSPDNLDLPEAYVFNNVLAPERQAFKAFIIRANVSLTASGVGSLVVYANQGLPIIFSGGLPTKNFGYQQAGGENLTAILEALLSLDNVHVVPYDGLASSLLSLGITPRTSISTNSTWYTYWREDSTTLTQYVIIYNDVPGIPVPQGTTTVGNIIVETTGKPFLYDAWTGEVTPLSSYQQSKKTTTVQLQLAGSQSVILGFQLGSVPGLHINNSPFITQASTVPKGNTSLELLVTYNTLPQSITLSNGTSMIVQPMLASPSTLTNWHLAVEAWGPPANLYDIEAEPTRTYSTFTLPSLLPWSQISTSLTNVSGLGYYHTTFTWPPINDNDTPSGAFIDLGAIVHTASLSINGHTLPPLDPSWAKVDIGPYLVSGQNMVDVVVSTPLGNGLRSIWGELVANGKPATANVPLPPSIAEYGLIQDVSLIPYRRDIISQ